MLILRWAYRYDMRRFNDLYQSILKQVQHM